MTETQTFRTGPSAFALWWGLFAGPIAWGLDETLSYAIVQHACSTGHHWLLHFYTLLAIVIAGSGFAVANWAYRRLPEADLEGGGTANRSRWMAIFGMSASIALTLVIIAGAIPKLLMNPCDQ
jgi:hypothetical protein